MFGRIITWIFYAAVFFLLGVWAGPDCCALSGLPDRLTTFGTQGWQWLSHIGNAERVDVTAVPPSAEMSAETYDRLLAEARSTYLKGDVSGAISRYRTLTSAKPDRMEARGELGNIYYETGQLREAAQIYFDLASRQIDLGDAATARQLEPAIRRGNTALADELIHRMGSAASTVGTK
jgi:thioredoxin-like negative regulator of GroEL